MNKVKKSENIQILKDFLSETSKFSLTSVIQVLKPLNSHQIAEMKFLLTENGVLIKKVKSSILKIAHPELKIQGDIFIMFDKNCIGINLIEKFNKQYPKSLSVVAVINANETFDKNMIKMLGAYESEKMIYNSLVGTLMFPIMTFMHILKQIGEQKTC